MTRRKRAPRNSATSRKEQILDVATKLFHKKGYTGASVQNLADAVGISKATLYYHIGSKERLLYEIHERFLNEGFELLEPLEQSPDSPTNKLINYFIGQCQLTHRRGLEMAVAMAELDRLSTSRRKTMVAKRDQYLDVLVRTLQAGVDSGEFRPIDPRLGALCVMGMVNWLHRWYQRDGALSPEDLGRFMASIVLSGLSAEPTAANLAALDGFAAPSAISDGEPQAVSARAPSTR
ncbi:MAG: TetR/AcrR family transcriptional regulator [Chloroflexi bacterium]|nr:TetR/AcrR family transcriptional regulator [Chloroflexota bacterium]